jgi:uncharacterized membrane protein YesL
MELSVGTHKRKVQAAIFAFTPIILYFILNRYWSPVDGESAIIAYKLFMFVYVLCTAIFCCSFAVRVHRSKQYPPPGAKMPFTAKIQKGKQALMQAYSLLFIALLLVIFGVNNYGIYLLRLLIDQY